jgi:50S ribosomal subunit-associated GTPase HflX
VYDCVCVCHAGLTNCGKTSVFNMLTNSNAIVDSTAFTTIGM